MTVSSQDTVFLHVGNGATTTFAYGCQVPTATDLEVYLNDVLQTTGYTITGLGAPTGGTVVFAAPPANLTQIRLQRVIELERTTDYQQNGDFLSRVVNPDFDRLWMALQGIWGYINRSLKFPASDSSSLNTTLPPAASRANKAVVFDAAGNVGVSVDDYDNQAANAAASAAAAAASASSAASSATSASASAASAASTYDTFDDRWLGAKNSEPALDNDGNALLEGAAYWDTPGKTLKVWSVATGLWYAITAFIQAGAGAISRTWQDKARERISILDYGVVSGSDDTTMFSSAIARASAIGGAVVRVPAGTWFTGQIVVPSNVKVRLDRGAVIKPKAGFALNAFWVVQSGSVDAEITGGSFEVDRATFASTTVIYVDASQNTVISDIRMPKSGLIGVYCINCTDVLIQRVRSFLVKNRNIQIDGASSARCRVVGCYVDAAGGIDHGITFSGGVDHEGASNYVTNALIFGVSLYTVTRCEVHHNTIYNTVREAINIQDGSDNHVTENICLWDNTTSQDFGMSIWGQAANGASFNAMRGNRVMNCGKSGIAIESSTSAYFNRIENNHIINSNRLNLGVVSGGGGGVIVYGTEAKNNDICNNTIYDSISTLKWGIFETNLGTGQASLNNYVNNKVTNANLGATSKAATSTEALCQTGYLTWNPTVTPGAGAITTLGTVLGKYWEDGKMVHFYISAAITTNGTGANDIRISLPFTLGANNALAFGRESGATGAALTGTAASGGTTLIVRKYDNSYPGANGAVIEMSGFFLKA